jgi:bla regulator protein BlaR1
MRAIEQMISSSWIEALGWTLLHSVWQSLLCLLLVLVLLRCLPSSLSAIRYGIATANLFLIFIASIATFILLSNSAPSISNESVTVLQHPGPYSTSVGERNFFAFALNSLASFFQTNLQLIVLAWGMGASLFSLRVLGGWWSLNKIKGSAVPANEAWSQMVQSLAVELGINRVIALGESALIQVPVVIGYIKPVILLPLGMLSGLSTAQLESIFIHELIHIRRGDYIVNLIQIFLEALFFFNPFIWIISGIIRREREHCCDDAVIKVHGNALAYAQALATLEEARLSRSGLALSFADNKKQLLNRIKRIMERSVQSYSGRERIIPAILLITGLICASWLTIQRKESETHQVRQADVIKAVPVSADTSIKIKIEMSGGHYKKTVTKFDKDGKPHEEVTEGYDGDEELQPLLAQMDFELAIPPVPVIPEIDVSCSEVWRNMRRDMIMAMQAIPASPELIINNFHLDTIPIPTPPGFDWHQNGNWDEFSREFEKFGDFFEMHGEEFEAMTKQLETNFNERSMEEFAAQMEQHEEVWAQHEEAMKNLEENMQQWEVANNEQLRQLDQQLRVMEERSWNVEKALREQLVKDGYLGSDEKIKSIEINNDMIKINDKEIKESDQKKYRDLLKKNSFGPKLPDPPHHFPGRRE